MRFICKIRTWNIFVFVGGVESSRDSLSWLLQNPGHGRAIGIVVGGAQEVLDARHGCFDLHLSHRGFVRFALRFGYISFVLGVQD
jgi:hypothetical protein